ncbi:hypothetical protein HDC90_001156 [Pedobacter sp. AK013]|uniref:hypothetical protein n=1 Tax=Pedobacter sp. AK013 TaxID=2723071 RepID=UPI00161404BD|nr:hypothetical protein [Pedobacter sp. AK013]MBB6236544.1 hypothetical protein [Pedobacter sp. AK013]
MQNQQQPTRGSKTVAVIISAVVVIGLVWFFFGGGAEKQAANQMATIENQVAEDAVKQYEIAKSGGDKTEIYVHAGLVSAAYLQAKDSVNYKKWKEIEKADAKAAGVTK